MVDVAGDHRGDQRRPDVLVVALLPAGQLVQHVQAELVAQVEEEVVRRVVRRPDGVHVQVLHQPDVQPGQARARGPAERRPERVPVGALEHDAAAVDIDAVAGPHLDGAEAEAHRDAVQAVQRDLDLVEVRRLGGPQQRLGDGRPQRRPGRPGRDRDRERSADRGAVQLAQLTRDPARGGEPGEEDVGGEGAVGPRVDGDPVDPRGRDRLEIDRAEQAAEVPEVAAPLGVVDRRVRRLLADRDLEQVGLAEPHQCGDVVAEPVEAALVPRAGRDAVDPHLGVGHRGLEDQEHPAARPGGRGREAVAVAALLLRHQRAAVVVGAESVQLPVRRGRDRAPHPAAAAAGHLEVPVDGVVGVGAGEVHRLGHRAGERRAGHGEAERGQPTGRAEREDAAAAEVHVSRRA